MKNLRLYLLLADLYAFQLAFFFAYTTRNYGLWRYYLDAIQPLALYLMALPYALALYLLVFYSQGLYSPYKRVTLLMELRLMFKTITLWWVLLMAVSYLTKIDYSRVLVMTTYLAALIFNGMTRFLVRVWQDKMISKNHYTYNILVVGAGRLAREMARRLKRYQRVGYLVVGFVDDKVTQRASTPLLGKFNDLPAIIHEYQVKEVFIANPNLAHEQILDMMVLVQHMNVRFRIASDIFDLATGRVDQYNIETIPALDLGAQVPLFSRCLKRVLDVVLSLTLLLVLSPLMMLVALLIKLTSPGPVLIKQERVGYKQFPFILYKFRTMSEETALYAPPPQTEADPRVTAIGRVLRKTSLDELPQLVNVLKGEMSLVGPRPEMPFRIKTYQPWQKARFNLKPGLTGLWQILGRKDLPLSENLEYDFYYLNNQSLILDLEILLRTIPVVLLGKGAY